MSLKARLKEQQILAMRAKDKGRLGTIRMLLAAIKQIEIDNKVELNDDEVTAVVIKSVKQRKDSIAQFEKANRNDLADIEKADLIKVDLGNESNGAYFVHLQVGENVWKQKIILEKNL